MAIPPQLQTQIAALQARIEAVAPTATPEDLVMLAKAIEAVGGQATVFDVIEAGKAQVADVIATTGGVQDAINEAGQQALSQIAAAHADSVQNINAIAMNTPALHSAALLF